MTVADIQGQHGTCTRKALDWTLPRNPARVATLRSSGVWRNRTLAEDALELARSDPARLIAVAGDRELTAGEAVAQGLAIAAALKRRGFTKGDTITVVLPNWLEAIGINLGAVFLGLVVNPIVPIYREAELRQILRDCGSRAVFMPGRHRSIDYGAVLDSIRHDLPELSMVVGVRSQGDVTLEELIADGRAVDFFPEPTAPEGIKLVMYTSGTTGPAKGVLHTHETLGRVMTVGAKNWELDITPRILIATPIGHITGFLWGLESPFIIGTRVFLMDRWDPTEAVRLIDYHQIDLTTGAAPFLQDTIEAARKSGSRLSSLKRFGCGGAAVTPDLIRSARATFAQAVAYRIYGSTEAPNIAQGHASPVAGDRSAETDGRPVDYEVRIVDDLGNDVAAGTDGEILARGPAMFVGYTDASLNEAAVDASGYLKTGDIGHFTALGDLVITDRKKDLIIRGGENLSPKEIEDALAGHPGVREIAIVGRPHPRLGETVCAFVVPSLPMGPTLDELNDLLAQCGFARQKYPDHLELVAALPRTPSGKVSKGLLRKQIAEKLIDEKRR
jgi:cyclohexanecarboxylate-CoA ligase